MPSRLFVGNLSYEATEEELTAHFSKVGPVSRVFIPLDRETGRARGFAFIEFPSADHAKEAIQQLHEQPFKERPLVVNEARPSESRPASVATSLASPRTTAGSGGFKPEARERTTSGSGPSKRPSPPKSKAGGGRHKRGGKKGFREEDPKKEPPKEKIGGRFYGAFDDTEDGDEDIDFENFATSEPNPDEDE